MTIDAPLHVAWFRNLFATTPHSRRVTVETLAKRLSEPRHVVSREERERAVPLWSPVEYRPGAERGSANVARVHWLVLDYDDGTPIETVRERWGGWVHIGHTSYSHMQGRPPTKQHPDGRAPAPALRVVLPLLDTVDADVWPLVMRRVLEGAGQEADRKCIDPARMFYAPCLAHEGAAWEHWVHMPAGDLSGPWLCLGQHVEAAREQMRRDEEERRRRLEEVAKRARDVVSDDRDAAREVRRRLLEDPRAREDCGHMFGGHVAQAKGAGRIVRGVECPACGQNDVWWAVEPKALRRARCNHRNTCGWEGHLWELAAAHGITLT